MWGRFEQQITDRLFKPPQKRNIKTRERGMTAQWQFGSSLHAPLVCQGLVAASKGVMGDYPSSPVMVPVLLANSSDSNPNFCIKLTNRFGNG